MKLVLFGNKTTTKSLLEHLITNNRKPHTLVTLNLDSSSCENISGVDKSLINFAHSHKIKVFKPNSYSLNQSDDIQFFLENNFDIGLCTGWQRLIPEAILESFKIGIFGWHGSGFEFPNGRGRSPINWSIRLGLEHIYHNCFKYNSGVDDGKLFDTRKIYIENNDYILDVIEKVISHIKDSSIKLIENCETEKLILKDQIPHAFITFPKLSEKDGMLYPEMSLKNAINIIRSCSKPFPGAFVLNEKNIKIRLWSVCDYKSKNYKNYERFITFENDLLYLKLSDGFLESNNYEIL